MPRPKPLGSSQAARATLAHRLTGRADRLRQLYTRFGVRSRRVFLVWTQSVGETVGSGSEVVMARREILPTPKVTDATAITRRPLSIGIVPDGSLRIDQISCGAYTEDNLRGRAIPPDLDTAVQPPPDTSKDVGGTPTNKLVVDPMTYFYEIVEDGRGDDPAARTRYKLLGSPWRSESQLYWGIFIEPMSGAFDRYGNPMGADDDVTIED